MKGKGLCATCNESSSCIFVTGPVVWECEEFSSNGCVTKGLKSAPINRVTSYQEVTESE